MAGKSIARLLLGGLGEAARGFGDVSKDKYRSDNDLYNALAQLAVSQGLEEGSPLYKARVADIASSTAARDRQAENEKRRIALSGEAASGVMDRAAAERQIAKDLRIGAENRKVEALDMPESSWFDRIVAGVRGKELPEELQQRIADKDLVAALAREKQSLIKSPEEQSIGLMGGPEQFGEATALGVRPMLPAQPASSGISPESKRNAALYLGDPQVAQQALVDVLTQLEEQGVDLDTMDPEDLMQIYPEIGQLIEVLKAAGMIPEKFK